VPRGDNSAALPLGLLFGAIAVLVLVIGLLALVRAVRRPKLSFGLDTATLEALDEAEELAEAVEAGSQALEYRGDAREAVIACYAAMEQAVHEFGFARPLADTPEDLLRRATEKGLVPDGPAARLTELFREARFSRHAITYTLSGRTLGTPTEVRERVLERHFVGVAWYSSMLRTSQERGGYERGLRTELTRLCAARLAERRGVNLYQDPAIARELVGPDLWPLVDPALHPRPGHKAPAVAMRSVAELIERLEQM
jgi:hypothetical protein